MFKLDMSNVVVDKSVYAGCGGVVPPGDPMFSGRAEVNYCSPAKAAVRQPKKAKHPEVNVPDNPEFRKIVFAGLKDRGLTEEEIEFCKEYLWSVIKSSENHIAYEGGDFDLDAQSVILELVYTVKTYIPRLIEKKIPFGHVLWGFRKVGDKFYA